MPAGTGRPRSRDAFDDRAPDRTRYQPVVKAFQKKLAAKLAAVRANDLGRRK